MDLNFKFTNEDFEKILLQQFFKSSSKQIEKKDKNKNLFNRLKNLFLLFFPLFNKLAAE